MPRRNAALEETMAAAGYVPAQVAADWARYALTSIHRAVAAGALPGQRVGARSLYVDWSALRTFVGPLAEGLPASAADALERRPC